MNAPDQCNCCGSSPVDRKEYAARSPEEDIPLGFTKCPHCGADKCCMCDMGDDVECLNCDGSDE